MVSPTPELNRYRGVLLALTILLIPIGYSVRFADGVPEWFRNIWGNVAYEMFWIFGFLAVFPKVLPRGMALAVCLASIGIEFLQLSQHPLLVAARSTLLGRLVLGNVFIWIDLPQYVLGSTIGWAATSWLRGKLVQSPASSK
jgi:glycopeptide antibiotics resistance protein